MLKKQLTLLALLALPMMMAGCASPTQGTNLGTLTVSGKPAACLSLVQVQPNRGKPGGPTVEDVEALLDKDNPIGRVRNMVGDTAPTIAKNDKNNAALKALCGDSNVDQGRH